MDTYDLGTLGPASIVSNGLQGLLEAYKMKLQQATENAKTMQAGVTAQAMMPYRMAMFDDRVRHEKVMENLQGGGNAAAIMARDTLNGTFDPATVPKRGALFAQYVQELDRQSQGDPQLLARAEAAKAKMFEAGPLAQRVQRSSDALVPLVDRLKSSLGYNPETGQYDKPTAQSNYPLINKLKSFIGRNVGGSDPRKDIESNVAAIKKEINMMSANGGSDANLSLAGEMINPDSSRKDLITGLETASQGLAAGRAQAYGGTNPFVPGGAPAAQPNPVATLRAALPSAKAPAPAPPPARKYAHLSDAEIQAAIAGGAGGQ